MSEAQIEAELRKLWGAYAHMRDNDLSAISTTSRLLHKCDTAYLRSRVATEMTELVGVISGEHRHRGLPHDVVLEGSQVCYWVYLLSLSEGIEYGQLEPHLHLVQGANVYGGERPRLSKQIDALAGKIETEMAGELLRQLQAALGMVGASCGSCGVEVGEIVKYDLAQMNSRDYLRGYFAAASGNG